MSPAANLVRSVQLSTQGFAKGVNMQDSPELLDPTEVRRAENGTFDERGAFTKRLGCKSQGTVGAGGDRIISVYVFNRGDTNSPHFMAHTTAGKVYYTTDPTASPVVWTQIGTGYSTSQPMSWETFNSKVYFCDGVSSYSSWDGAALITYGSAPKAKYLRLWKDTMWAAGASGYPDRVYSSASGDAETWPGASWVDIRHGDGDAVRALASDGVYLLVGKRETGSLIYDPALFYNRVYDFEKGIESHWGVIQHEENIFYLTRRGVAEWQGDAPAKIISYKIDPIFDPHVINYNYMGFAWAYTHGHKVSWTIPEVGSTVPTLQINYYPRLAELTALGVRGLGPWSFDRMPVQCPVLWRWSSQLLLFSGSTIANKLYWLFADDTGTDDGTTFSATLETGMFEFGAPILTKYIRRMRVLGRGVFYVQLKRDFDSAAYRTYPIDFTTLEELWGDDNWGDEPWGSSSKTKAILVNPDAYGKAFSLLFQDSGTDTSTYDVPAGSEDIPVPVGNWAILGVTLDGNLLGVRP